MDSTRGTKQAMVWGRCNIQLEQSWEALPQVISSCRRSNEMNIQILAFSPGEPHFFLFASLFAFFCFSGSGKAKRHDRHEQRETISQGK